MTMWSFITSRGVDLGPEDGLTAARLARHVADLGLKAGGMTLTLQGGTVTLTGRAANAAIREKVILAVGNVQGIAAVRDRVPSDHAPHFYTVVPGDTLAGIARLTLGDPGRHREVFEANQPLLADPESLYHGQVLRIPRG